MDGGLLVPHLQHLKLILLNQGIRKAQRAVARNADDVGHTLADEGFDDDLSTGEFHNRFS